MSHSLRDRKKRLRNVEQEQELQQEEQQQAKKASTTSSAPSNWIAWTSLRTHGKPYGHAVFRFSNEIEMLTNLRYFVRQFTCPFNNIVLCRDSEHTEKVVACLKEGVSGFRYDIATNEQVKRGSEKILQDHIQIQKTSKVFVWGVPSILDNIDTVLGEYTGINSSQTNSRRFPCVFLVEPWTWKRRDFTTISQIVQRIPVRCITFASQHEITGGAFTRLGPFLICDM